MSFEYPPFGITDGDAGIAERIRTAVNRIRLVLRHLVYWAITLAWTGFWLLVVRLHYLQNDWEATVVTGAMAITPLVGISLWYARRITDRRPLAALDPG